MRAESSPQPVLPRGIARIRPRGSLRGWLARALAGILGGRGPGRRLNQKFTWAMERLNRLSSSTEGDFLRLGEQVQEFFLSAQTMSDQGAQVVEMVSGQAVSEATQRLQLLVEETKLRFNSSRQGFLESVGILDTVRLEAANACQPLAGFQKMVMGLRVLGISTRMESARLQGQDEGFQFLAEEVSRLSDTIQAQTEGIAAQLKDLTAGLDQALGDMGRLGSSLDGDVGNLVAVVGQSLDELQRRRGQSEAAAAAMAASTRQVHASVAEVVSSQQFHDITRQRLEHVSQALGSLRQGRGQASPSEVCGLQTALLRHAVAELAQAAAKTQESLRAIALSVRQVAREARRLMRGDEGRELSFLGRLEADLSRVMDIVSQTEEAASLLRTLVESVVQTLEKVGSSLRAIDNISYSIKFVALNAAIKSARLGENGSTLGSLAQAIQQLSAEAQATTQALGEVLKKMEQSALSLRKAMALGQEPAHRAVQELTAVLESIRDGGVACDLLLGEMEQRGQGLAQRLEREADGIGFHLGIQEGVAEVVDCLAEIRPPRGAAHRRQRPTGALAAVDMAQSYTMASERQVHQAWAQGAAATPPPDPAPAAPPKPSAAQAEDALAAPAPPQAEADDLGDNVELF